MPTPSSETDSFIVRNAYGQDCVIKCDDPPVPLPHVHFLVNDEYPSYALPGSAMRDDAHYTYVSYAGSIASSYPKGTIIDRHPSNMLYADLDKMLSWDGAHTRYTLICAGCNRHIRWNEILGTRSRPTRKLADGTYRPLRFTHADCNKPFGAVHTWTRFPVPDYYKGPDGIDGGQHDPHFRPENMQLSTAAGEDTSAKNHATDDNSSDSADEDTTDQTTLDSLSNLITGIFDKVRAEYDPKISKLERENMALKQLIADAESNKARTLDITILTDEADTTIKSGLAHKSLPLLLKGFQSIKKNIYRNAWLMGPAGTGKTTAARQVAEVLAAKHGKTLGVDFHLVIIGTVASQYDMRGFIDGNGRIQSTELEKAWREGGVILWDEFRGNAWDAVLWCNGGWSADGYLPFASGMVMRHPDTYCMVADNTWGYGGDAKIQGNPVDQTTLSRFIKVYWGADEEMEHAITGTDPVVVAWTDAIQETRKLIETTKAQVTITPRQMYLGQDFIEAAILTASEIVSLTVEDMRQSVPSKWEVFGAPIIAWETRFTAEINRRITERERKIAEMRALRAQLPTTAGETSDADSTAQES